MTMGRLAIALCVLFTLPLPFGFAQNGPTLRPLYDSHQWFELRDAMQGSSDPLLYRAALAYAFNNFRNAQDLLRRVIDADPKSQNAADARQKLEDIYERNGQYGRLLGLIDEELAANPDDAGLKTDRATIAPFARDQITAQRKFSKIRYSIVDGGVSVPLSINGKSANFDIDTDMNISMLSESEAARLGLPVHNAEPNARKYTGAAAAQAPYRTADADELTIGNVQLAHVAFIVVPDSEKPFVDLPPGKQGILGIPVLLALRAIRWTDRGFMEIGFEPKPTHIATSNICFDGMDPVTLVRFRDRELEFILDTGDQGSDLFPPFAKNFAKFVAASGKEKYARVTGVDGSTKIRVVMLPDVNLWVGGFDAGLRPARLLLQKTVYHSDLFNGRVGMAIFRQAREVSIDFGSMTLALK